MGDISKKLHRKLASNGAGLPIKASKGLPGNVKDVRMLLKEGFDPIHAVYVYIQQISSLFAEGASQLAELKDYAKIAAKAEDDYMPSAPPISPLTTSFFTTWAFYDLRFGRDGDTIAQCQIEANDLIGLNPDQLRALKMMANSRMGIYEHIGMEGPHVRLRELITDVEFAAHSTSGYAGRTDELWYVRLLPPLEPELATYSIAFTTPYILMTSKADWVSFLRRSMLQFKADSDQASLHRLSKFGSDPNYWNEFVFKAYHHHQPNAIYLAGIPDLQGTLPNA